MCTIIFFTSGASAASAGVKNKNRPAALRAALGGSSWLLEQVVTSIVPEPQNGRTVVKHHIQIRPRNGQLFTLHSTSSHIMLLFATSAEIKKSYVEKKMCRTVLVGNQFQEVHQVEQLLVPTPRVGSKDFFDKLFLIDKVRNPKEIQKMSEPNLTGFPKLQMYLRGVKNSGKTARRAKVRVRDICYASLTGVLKRFQKDWKSIRECVVVNPKDEVMLETRLSC